MAEKIDSGVNNGTDLPIFKLGDQNYHSIGSLLPPDSLRPTFAQLYIYDTENEIDNRIGTLHSNGAINERDREIVAILRNMLDKYNSLAKSFRYARDRYQQKNCTNIKLKLISERTTDGRTYNLLSASEVAALIVGNVEQLSKDRDIIIESQSRKLQRIDKGQVSKQPQLRVDKYKGLHESLINGDVDAARLGKRIILPSTFIGGPRYTGYPSYFITMTYVCTVEFQKRGLLHAHILLFMSNEFKPQTPDDIDKHTTAKIPDENERPNLHGAVQNYMFGCHINVEYTCQTSSIKYLFKYVHKGNDRITATLYNAGDLLEATQVVDEIKNYYDCRYISDEKEFIDAIKEESSWASGSYVRRLFVILLTSNNISRPEHVWDRCWHELSDDILYRQRAVMNMRELIMSDDEIKQLCIMNIDNILHFYGKILKDYPPMPLTIEVDSSLLTERVITEELNFNRDDLKKNASDILAIATPEQRYAFDKIVTAVYCDEGGFFFVYGLGGTGKTFFWNLMSAEICLRGNIVLNVASSGIASLLLPNARTAHSRFKIPLNITEDSVCNIKPGSHQAMWLLKAKLII
ncbi:uncharacterized protein [Arachis hypogaea]|uniref:uncharacterized protein n=1 Tax=Arachis hypogaea TaxID=3818 RepID=UPI003B20DE25